MEMKYYAKDVEGLRAIETKYPGVYTVEDLYDALTRSWCLETCAPRLRHLWSPEDMTVGQCSVTAFLAQDIFGGKGRKETALRAAVRGARGRKLCGLRVRQRSDAC